MKILGKIENSRLPDVETQRLFLRHRTVADAKDILAYVSLPEVAIPAAFPLVETLEDEINYIEKFYPQRLVEEKLPAGWGLTLKGQNRVIGSVDFNKRHEDKVLEIGYTLHPDYWGQGYIPEACQALLEIGFGQMKLEKILIHCYDYNRQSQRVAEKLGFRFLEEGEPIEDPAGRSCRNWTYQLTKQEWEANKGKTEILEVTRQFVQNALEGEASGHDWWHIVRVTNTTVTLAKQEKADLFICQMAALLHDIADEKLNPSQEVGLKKVRDFLGSQGLGQEQIEQIMAIVANISFKGEKEPDQPLSLEGKIVQDADRLDVIGAIGIARTMAYSGNKGRPIHDPSMKPRENLSYEDYRNGQDTAIMHFYEKLLKLKDFMNTPAAKQLAQGRHDFLQTYLEQFYAEWDGER